MFSRASNQKISVAVLIAFVIALLGITACSQSKTVDTLLSEARQYQQKGDNKAAIIQLKNALQKNPDTLEARYLLGTIYNDIGDPLSAEKELNKALSLGMDPAKVLPNIGKSWFMQGQYQKILDETKLLSSGKFDASISNLRGNAFLALGKNKEAKENFEFVLKEQKNSPDALIGLAKLSLAERNEKAAMQFAKQATGNNPENMDAWLFQGDLLRSKGEVDSALAAYDQAIKIKPDNLSANIAKAYLFISVKKYEDAQASINAARKYDPSHIIVYYTQALLDFTQGKAAAALDSLQQVLRVAPEHMPSLLLAGNVQFALGSMPQAEQYLNKYLEQNPENLYARKLMVSTLLKSGQAKRAIKTLTPALVSEKQDIQLLALAGESYMLTGDFATATNYFEKASKLAPDAANIRTSLGMSKLGQGDNSRAISELEKAISLDAKSPQAGFLLVMTQLKLKEYEKALVAVRALEKEQPDNALVQNLKGGIFIAKKEFANARASFQKALDIQPGFFPAAENLAQLDIQDKNPELAKQRFLSLLEKDKKNIQAMTALAKLAQSQNKTEEVTDWLEKANKENPDALLPAMQLAAHYLHSGEKNKALTLTQTYQVSNPDNPDLLDLLAQAQIANNKADAALETYHKLSVLLPGSALVQLRIANVHLSMNNLHAAEEAVKKSLALQADFTDALLAQASLEMRKANYAGAIAIAKKIQKSKHSSPLGYVMEGDVLLTQKKPTLAITPYEHAFTLSKTGSVLAKLHTALRLSGKSKEADTRILLWLKDHPNDAATRMYLAASCISEHKYNEAIAQYQTVLQQHPDNPEILNNLAWAYYQAKDSHALEYAEKAHKISADSPAILDTLGWILSEQGNTARGLPLLKKAVSLAPEAAEIRFHLAKSLVNSGDKTAARKELEDLLASGKPFADSDAAKSLLKQL